MAEVWVLETGSYDDQRILGVYTSHLAAMAALRHGCWLWGQDPNDPDRYVSASRDTAAQITRYDVENGENGPPPPKG